MPRSPSAWRLPIWCAAGSDHLSGREPPRGLVLRHGPGAVPDGGALTQPVAGSDRSAGLNRSAPPGGGADRQRRRDRPDPPGVARTSSLASGRHDHSLSRQISEPVGAWVHQEGRIAEQHAAPDPGSDTGGMETMATDLDIITFGRSGVDIYPLEIEKGRSEE